MKRLTLNKHIVGDTLNIELIGCIDEDSDFTEIIDTKAEKINFNFDKVEMINSCGIREWIKFLDQLGSRKIIYENCPQIIIEQINMVHGFIRPESKLVSFYAPYYCEHCDKESKIHLLSENVHEKKAPEVKCPYCGEDAEFDAIESSYFNFLGK